MSVSELSSSVQNYLKVIWGLGEWRREPVTTTIIAEKMQLSNSSVSGALRRLAEQDLIHYTPYKAVELTEAGRRYAVEMVRRHRLLESFLVEVLGFGSDEVHAEAEDLEHAVSERLISRIDSYLGHPVRDPHGDPIPAVDGSVTLPNAVRLSEVAAGTTVRVERVDDEDPELVLHLERHGVCFGAQITINESPAFSETMIIQVFETNETMSLGPSATGALYVAELSHEGH